VDNHFHTAGYDPNCIEEVHGTTERWQCSVPCALEQWSAPKEFRFEIDPETLLAPKKSLYPNGTHYSVNNGFINNHPLCKNCGKAARPAVYMFADYEYVPVNSNISLTWWDSVVSEKISKDNSLNIVILEIGCGLNVPTARSRVEQIASKYKTNCTLIRVNPDFPLIDIGEGISIMASGLQAVQLIDKAIQESLQ